MPAAIQGVPPTLFNRMATLAVEAASAAMLMIFMVPFAAGGFLLFRFYGIVLDAIGLTSPVFPLLMLIATIVLPYYLIIKRRRLGRLENDFEGEPESSNSTDTGETHDHAEFPPHHKRLRGPGQGDHAQGAVRPALRGHGRSRLDHQHRQRPGHGGGQAPPSCSRRRDPKRDMSTEVLGQRISMPVMLAPTGTHQRAHPAGELASARAAAAADTIMGLSTASSYSIEEVAEVADNPLWFQLYFFQDRELTEILVRRAENAGLHRHDADGGQPGRQLP